MSDPFHSSKYCIDHADRRILELIREINAFIKTNPCERVIQRNSRTKEEVHKIKLVKPMPAPLSGITFDVVNSLRSALDHAGFATAIAGRRTKGRNAHFPFGSTGKEVRGRAKGMGRSRDIPKEIFDVMVKCKPYRRGNPILWAINELCNTHKHEIIIPFCMGAGGRLIAAQASGSGPAFFKTPLWDRTKNEMEIARVGIGCEPKYDFQFSFYVAIGKVNVVAGKPVTSVLERMLKEVRLVLMVIEAEATRIRLFK